MNLADSGIKQQTFDQVLEKPEHADLKATLRYWHDVCDNARSTPPPASAFDLLELDESLVDIMEIHADPGHDYTIHFQGVRHAETIGVNLTNQTLGKLTPEVQAKWLSAFNEIAVSNQPYFFRDALHSLDRSHVDFDGLILPLCGDSGAIDRFIAHIVFTPTE